MTPLTGALLALALVAPASAGTTRSRPSLGLTASPARVVLNGSGGTTVRIANTGTSTVAVDVQRAGFALDLRGRPRILPRAPGRSASSWLIIRPLSFALGPGATTSLAVTAKVPRRAEPGDHDALVLLTARPRPHGGLVVRMRLGLVVAVRAPGSVVHRLVPLKLVMRAHEPGGGRTFELLVANLGNVTEELVGGSASLALGSDGRTIAKIRGEPRRLLPRSRGVIVFRSRGRLHGATSAVVTLTPTAGAPPARQSFRLRL
jgi:hypothetical protein